MVSARHSFAASMLLSGRVLVVGGFLDQSVLSSAELYDPALNVWYAASSMATKRTYHTANTLSNGKALVVGGVNGNTTVSGAELYVSLTNGTDCVLSGDCASGFCADGVCCNSACNVGPCDVCSIALGELEWFLRIAHRNKLRRWRCLYTVDACQMGVCAGGGSVVCVPIDQCHEVGTCDHSTGICSSPAKSNGTACNDEDACTLKDILHGWRLRGHKPRNLYCLGRVSWCWNL